MSVKAIAVVVVCLVLYFAALIADVIAGSSTVETAKILERSHSSARSASGVGVDSSGNPVVTVTSVPEDWNVIVELRGELKTIKVTAKVWQRCEPGQQCQVREWRTWTGALLNRSIAE